MQNRKAVVTYVCWNIWSISFEDTTGREPAVFGGFALGRSRAERKARRSLNNVSSKEQFEIYDLKVNAAETWKLEAGRKFPLRPPSSD